MELERRLQDADQGRQVSQADHLKRYQRDWNTVTVRPGGNIFVQVIDPAANTGDRPGTVKVTLKTSSGDVLEGFDLRETAPHSGIFRGAVPTGIPRPKATASDTEEGRGVNGVINSASPAPWVSLADGKQPKWLEVDTMTSHLVSSYRAEIPNAASIREATLEWQLAGDYEELAHYPPRHPGRPRAACNSRSSRNLAARRPSNGADWSRRSAENQGPWMPPRSTARRTRRPQR